MNKTIMQFSMDEDRVFVIGNGPSFTKTMEKYKNTIINTACIVVNYFCLFEDFCVIKPKYYTVVDPGWFKGPETINPKVFKVVSVFQEKIDWDITVFVPECFCNAWFITEIRKNERVNVVTFCDRIRKGGIITSERVRMKLQELNLLIPPSQTVLNLALWLVVFFGVKEIYLLGADTSYLEEIRVDQENNDVIVNDNHFNDCFSYRTSDDFGHSMLAAQLEDLARALREYEYIGRYAHKRGCKIYNASEYSYIDVFERKKPV